MYENLFRTEKLAGSRSRGPNGELPETVVQIDESLLRGRRKSRRVRMLRGDQTPSLAEIHEFNLLHDDNDEDANPLKNYGRRIEGPQIFGMAECHLIRDNNTYQTKSVKLFHTERRDAFTLIQLIRDDVEAGSTMWSYQWGEYSRISTEIPEINHETVDHSVEFVATNATHTQNIERV
ncbi:hypothetical protein RF11_14846 [Thelohanellus kitauei]|uniref:Uncharacterized protein n=1 Tax=Thelohanellus kitauei TaxID=669202 RepID=A0A0C2JMC9_THEKT|nr:hypothetical protein RF11_14846 [Thelohanellus kitauei]